MALEAGSYGYEGLMRRRKNKWLMPAIIGGALGAVGFLAYKKATALPEIADPWAGPDARQATLTPMQGLGSLGCGCGMPIRGY
jgi:hypothetical protein